MVVLAIGLLARSFLSSSSQLPCLQSSSPFPKVRLFRLWREDTVLIVLAEQPTKTLSTALVQFHTAYSEFDHGDASSNTPLQVRDHPDHDFYQNSNWTHSLIYVMVTYAIGVTTEALTLSSFAYAKLIKLLIPTLSLLSYHPIYIPLTIWMFVMLSMLLEDISCAQKNVLRSFMGMTRKSLILWCKIIFVGLSISGSFVSYIAGPDLPVYCLCANAAMYCVLSVMVLFTTVRHGNVF
jgi:hypothetical protein